MGVAAMRTYPSFLHTIRKLDLVLSRVEPKRSFSLEETLIGKSNGERFNDAEITQPLCTAIQIAIVDLLTEWHVKPSVTIGHSSGEIGAAVCIYPLRTRFFAYSAAKDVKMVQC